MFPSPIGDMTRISCKNMVTKICELCQADPDWGRKMFATPIGDSIRFSGKNENQSISVINNFLSRSFKKKLNGKKLDFYILKGLDL